MTHRRKRIRGCLLGGGAGDALGTCEIDDDKAEVDSEKRPVAEQSPLWPRIEVRYTPLDRNRERALMFSKDAAVLQGTIELLVLKRLSQGPMHGYGIASWIETATDDVLRVEEGSLYPALYRMVQKRWIKGEWGVSENNRRAKFYRLTPSGEREFEQQAHGWLRLSDAVSRAVTTTALLAPRGRR